MQPARPLRAADVLRDWIPLALSWLLMAIEDPFVVGAVTKLPDSTAQLAGHGGLSFPLAILIETPIIMLLAASTKLCTDRAAYRRLLFFSHALAVVCTVVHVAVAFTPLFDVIVGDLMGAPAETLEPARRSLQWMTPWTWAIADRRFHQGVLIRFGHASSVTKGTGVRLLTLCLFLAVGLWTRWLDGAALAGGALSFAVFCEAIAARCFMRKVLRGPLAEHASPPPGWKSIAVFYWPLAITPLIGFIGRPIGSTAMAQMPNPVDTLAVWGPLMGSTFLLRSVGHAFNEVVVKHAGAHGARRTLFWMGLTVGGVASLISVGFATPFGAWYFEEVLGLEPKLAELARYAAWFVAPIAILNCMHSYWQGFLVHFHKTRAITESVVCFLVVDCVLLALGVWSGKFGGLVVAGTATSIGYLAQGAWLWWRARGLGQAASELQ